MAEWLERWTCDQQVAGSNSGRRVVECNPGQVVHTSTSSSTIIGTGQNGRRRSAAGYINLGSSRTIAQPTAGFMASATYVLTIQASSEAIMEQLTSCLFNVP